MFKTEMAEPLQGLKLYIHKEPDTGGDTFTAKVYRALKDTGFSGEVYRWSCHDLGVKDPSDVYLANGQKEGGKLIRSLLAQAEPINLETELLPEIIPGAPIRLRQPEGFLYSDKGISAIDPKTGTPANVCRTPIILTQRLKSLETGDERIEIAFKRDDRWHTAIYPRSTIFSSRKITDLADLGCTITSENARQVVKFLGALEAENIDVIPRNDATSTFGWQPGRRFLPGHDNGITLDIDPSQRGMAAAYCKNGTLERWVQHMAPHRSRDKFRFILAASFAAPSCGSSSSGFSSYTTGAAPKAERPPPSKPPSQPGETLSGSWSTSTPPRWAWSGPLPSTATSPGHRRTAAGRE